MAGDKTEGEAAIRVRGCEHGNGIMAYMTIYKWYTGATGQAMSDRFRKLMSPGVPKSEADIVDAIEKWVDAGRLLENMKAEYKLADPFKMTALVQFMNVGHAKLHFEALRSHSS